MSDEYTVRNIDLNKLSDHVRSRGSLPEEAALHLMDTIRVMREDYVRLQAEMDGRPKTGPTPTQPPCEPEVVCAEPCQSIKDGWHGYPGCPYHREESETPCKS